MPKIRNMTMEDLSVVIGWAGQEGWNPGQDDTEAFYETDRDGFFVSVVNDEPVAAISVVNHSDGFAFLGLYICRPECRGQGIGRALWNHAVLHADGRTIGLDGVADQQDNYRKSGFDYVGETLRYEGLVRANPHPDMRAVEPADIDSLTALEGSANGFPKKKFLGNWLCDTDTRKTIVLERGCEIFGFATVRECLQGFKVGPLVALNFEDACTLLHCAAEISGGQPLVVDVPGDNKKLGEYCSKLGMSVSFRTARMYKGKPPTSGQYFRTVATLELG